jgi:hypothetical protein
MKKIFLIFAGLLIYGTCHADPYQYWQMKMSTPTYIINGAVCIKDVNASTSTSKLWLFPDGTAGVKTLILNGVNMNDLLNVSTSTTAGLESLTQNLLTETSSRIEGDATLSGDISTETSDRIAADSSIGVATATIRSDLSSETNSRQNTDNSLMASTGTLLSSLNSEISSRTIGDNELKTSTGILLSSINSEINTRTSSDNAIGITTATLRTDLGTESSNRINGDNAIGASTGTLRTDLTSLQQSTFTVASISLALSQLQSGTLANGIKVSTGSLPGTATPSTFLRGDGTWNLTPGAGDMYNAVEGFNIGQATATLRSDLSTETQNRQNADISIGIATGTTRSDLTALAVSTGTLFLKSGGTISGNTSIQGKMTTGLNDGSLALETLGPVYLHGGYVYLDHISPYSSNNIAVDGDWTFVNKISTSSLPGTATASTYLRGDGTWATPAGSGDMNNSVEGFNIGQATATLRSDLSTESNNRINADNNIGITTASIHLELVNAENAIGVSTGNIVSSLSSYSQLAATETYSAQKTYQNQVVISSGIHYNEAKWTGGNITYVPLNGNIQTYIDNAIAGDTLVLASGKYTITTTLTIGKQLNIVGQGHSGFATTPVTPSHGTLIYSNTNGLIEGIQISSDNIRIANLSINLTGQASTAINTASNLKGLVLQNIDVIIECVGVAQGFTIRSTNAVLRDLTFHIHSSNTAAYGLWVYNNGDTLQNSIVDCFSVTGSVQGAGTEAYAFACQNENSAYSVTLNLSNSVCRVESGTPLDIAVAATSDTTNNAIVNCYLCTLDGDDYDAYQTGTNQLNLGGSVLVNKKTFGSPTYRATMAAGNGIFGGTLLVSSGSITDSSGEISFDNENLTTSGNISATNITSIGVSTASLRSDVASLQQSTYTMTAIAITTAQVSGINLYAQTSALSAYQLNLTTTSWQSYDSARLGGSLPAAYQLALSTTNWQAYDSSRLNGQLASYYATASSLNNYQLNLTTTSWQAYDSARLGGSLPSAYQLQLTTTTWKAAAASTSDACSGNAATVSNGVYSNGSYTNPSWVNSIAASKLTDAVVDLQSVKVGTSTISLSCSGNAVSASAVAASGVTSGTFGDAIKVSTASLPGTASPSTYLRGDGTWQTVSAGTFMVSPSTGIIGGGLADAVKITTANVTATGTPNSGTYFRGDGSWSTPTGAGDMSKATYDANSNNIVDNSEALNGHADTYFQTNLTSTSWQAYDSARLGGGLPSAYQLALTTTSWQAYDSARFGGSLPSAYQLALTTTSWQSYDSARLNGQLASYYATASSLSGYQLNLTTTSWQAYDSARLGSALPSAYQLQLTTTTWKAAAASTADACSGNAATVTNGVYTNTSLSGDVTGTIGATAISGLAPSKLAVGANEGVRVGTATVSLSCSGNAATVTNGIYSNTSLVGDVTGTIGATAISGLAPSKLAVGTNEGVRVGTATISVSCSGNAATASAVAASGITDAVVNLQSVKVGTATIALSCSGNAAGLSSSLPASSLSDAVVNLQSVKVGTATISLSCSGNAAGLSASLPASSISDAVINLQSVKVGTATISLSCSGNAAGLSSSLPASSVSDAVVNLQSVKVGTATIALSCSGNAAGLSSSLAASSLSDAVVNLQSVKVGTATISLSCSGNAASASAIAASGITDAVVNLQSVKVGTATISLSCSGNAAGLSSSLAASSLSDAVVNLQSVKVGTATISLSCSGNAATATTAGTCSGNAATVTNGVYTNTSFSGDVTGTVGATSISGLAPSKLATGTNEGVRVGTATISISCSGNAATASAVAASGVTAGTFIDTVKVSTASMPGTATASTYLRGDGTWQTVSGSQFMVSPTTGIISGQIADGVKVTTANVTATGSPGASTYFRGDGSWATPSGSGDMSKATYDTNSDNIVDKAARLATIYDVKVVYGAVGNGSTDDASAIQSAINAASAAGGGTVYFSSGTYLIGSEITLKSNITLRGDNATLKLKNGCNATMFYCDTENYINFYDLIIDGNKANNSIGTWPHQYPGALITQHSGHLRIQHCRFTNQAYGVGFMDLGSKDVVIDDNYFFNTDSPIDCYGVGVVISNNVIEKFINLGIQIEPTDVAGANINEANPNESTWLTGDYQQGMDISIHGNILRDGDQGIVLHYGCVGVSVVDNHISSMSTTGINLAHENSGKGLVVTGNTVRNIYGYKTSVTPWQSEGAGIILYMPWGGIVSNNTVEYATTGIFCTTAWRTIISNNLTQFNYTSGICLYSSTGAVVSNNFSYNDFNYSGAGSYNTGILLYYSTNILVEGNYCVDMNGREGSGVNCYTDSINNTIGVNYSLGPATDVNTTGATLSNRYPSVSGVTFANGVKASTITLTTGGGANKYLVSDASGNGSWATIAPSQLSVGTNEGVRVGTATVSASCSGNATTATTATNVAASGVTAGALLSTVYCSSFTTGSYENIRVGTATTSTACTGNAATVTNGIYTTTTLVGDVGGTPGATTIGATKVTNSMLGSGVLKTYDYAVCISSPYALGTTTFSVISPYRSYAVTITTVSAHVVGGTNCVFTIEQRDTALSDATTGTNCLTSTLTATASGWTGGTASDFTVPANSCLAIKISSVSGAVDRLVIQYRITVD